MQVKDVLLPSSSHPTAYKQKCTRPLVTAAEQGNVGLLKLFLKYQYTIPQPHLTGCECDACVDDKLGQQYHRLSTLKGRGIIVEKQNRKSVFVRSIFLLTLSKSNIFHTLLLSFITLRLISCLPNCYDFDNLKLKPAQMELLITKMCT